MTYKLRLKIFFLSCSFSLSFYFKRTYNDVQTSAEIYHEIMNDYIMPGPIYCVF